ncbi:carboxylating nicotinate-nucleotide diphosphorylase [Klugiella xanthotipulae]|uniref:Nicotinate-nucleotide pyrophosphorylase [carboxylating] n=1 Tax=Klugiella xanthotipulae TaxID=244735 RepID=A0A543I625_9MICO|nr:carboxylating nicotinate-nucleotide diphosphorylase [Klugiella xanthotipulae]TQM66029.1 nicotinate-nucleotide pyrophosphorylase [carboxylating] [Klugiella xanthotipulae]
MLTADHISTLVRDALREDAPWGDITAESVIPADAVATAQLVARVGGVLSGGEIWAAAFRAADPRLRVDLHRPDGRAFTAEDVLATVTGPARPLLTAERVALNFVQHLSGISTLTAAYVAEVAGTRARITDTRKTTPGLRAAEKYAVRCGGGHNHRFGLSDAVMVKDNHLAVLRESSGETVTAALRGIRERVGHTTHIEVEVDRLDQIEEVLAAGIDTIMLDNFSCDELRAGVALVAGRAVVEASGGITLETVAGVAATGVDVISVGALTHSAPSLDLGLDITIEVEPGAPSGGIRAAHSAGG